MKRRMTELGIQKMKAPKGKVVEVWDAVTPGLYLVARSSGRKTFHFRYRAPGGKQKSVLMGEHASSSRLQGLMEDHPELRVLQVDQARQMAELARQRVRNGDQPFAHTTKKSGRTLADVVELYAVQKLPKLRRGWEQERILRKDVLPRMGHLAPEQVTGEHVLELMESIGEPPPVGRGSVSAANAAKRALSAMFGWMSKPMPTEFSNIGSSGAKGGLKVQMPPLAPCPETVVSSRTKPRPSARPAPGVIRK